jgi:hypothetical protein
VRFLADEPRLRPSHIRSALSQLVVPPTVTAQPRGGIPFLNPPAKQVTLVLTNHRLYANSGIVLLEYDIVRKEPPSAGKP